MRFYKILGMILLLCLLTGCSRQLPEVPGQETLLSELPEELTTVTLMEEAQAVTASLEILERDTDLTKQTDDVTCAVTLTGDGFTVEYTCILRYAYVRSTGWTMRDYERTGTATLTVDGATWLDYFREESLATLTAAGYSDLQLCVETWDAATSSYVQGWQTEQTGTFLTECCAITVTGVPEQVGTALAWTWTTATTVEEATQQLWLEGTVWHLLDEEGTLELVILIESVDEGSLTFRGVQRSVNWRNAVKESTISSTTVAWTVTEHGCITFPLLTVDGEQLTVYIQEDSQWVTSDVLLLTYLQQEELPDSGKLSDLMELETTPSLWETLVPDVQETPEPEEGTAEVETETTTEESTGFWRSFWNSLSGIWN